MKLSLLHIGILLFFLFFLAFSSETYARPLNTEQGRNTKVNDASGEYFVLELEAGESLKKHQMEMEDSKSKDEECLLRRMTLEAHLDYIYTQHHKP